MSSSSESDDLSAVLRPLRFAAKNDFKNLSVVRGLENAVLAGLRSAPPSSTVETLKRLAGGIDQLSGGEKRTRITGMLAVAEGRVHETPAEQVALFKAPRSKKVLKAAPKVEAKSAAKRIRMTSATPQNRLADVIGVGPKTAERLAARGLHTVQDGLFFLPIRYEDRSRFIPIVQLEEGQTASVRGRVSAASMRMMGRRKRMFEIAVKDDTGALSCRFFRFSKNQMEAKFSRGVDVVVSGKVTKWGAMRQMVHPEMVVFGDDEPQPEGVLPVYPEIQGVPKRTLSKILASLAEVCSDQIDDPLPASLQEKYELPPLAAAVRRAHRPEKNDTTDPRGALEAMRARLVFDELFYMQLALARLRRRRDDTPGIENRASDDIDTLAARLLPFELTGAQRRAIDTIENDLASARPMNRLLMGDVGSGKTAVAFLAAALVKGAGRQTALLAPTEILAEQHFRNALAMLEEHGFDVRLLTGSTKAAARTEILAGLRAKTVDLLVGTHAILEPPVRFADLGLAIVDEQHRFGVEQRSALAKKREDDAACDVLVMTATPIPRTLSLTAYGDLRTTIIDELPPGRSPTETVVFPLAERERAYRVVESELAEGRQAYVVFPLVEESDKLDLTAATVALDELKNRFAPRLVGLLHGRMKPEEKSAVMAEFIAGRLAVLASTTVIEVGVDVKNAAVMVVEHAERFGLSQLHQLRGRVGRGSYTGRCVLLADAKNREAFERVKILAETNSGFEVAERDLQLRGAGEILGTRQSGLPDLALADLVNDAAVLERARDEAFSLLETDPELRNHPALEAELLRRFSDRLRLAQA